MLKGIDHVRDLSLGNTRRFANGLPANNALLCAARGMGKSSLVKAAHAEINREVGELKLLQIHREDINSLPKLTAVSRSGEGRFLFFCDDLSFGAGESEFKSLKAALDGGIDGSPTNTIFYATSNRRHLIPREVRENELSTALVPHEAVEEKVSLSDRFGLWLGFLGCSQDEYLEMVRGYGDYFGLDGDDQIVAEELGWSVTRGVRSGRVAWHFSLDLAGRLGIRLDGADRGSS